MFQPRAQLKAKTRLKGVVVFAVMILNKSA